MLRPNCLLIENSNILSFELGLNSYSNIYQSLSILPFSKARTKAILRIGPHNIDFLSVLICGMLGDWWSHAVPGRLTNSARFQIEQAVSNSAYIHYLNLYLYNLGYCSSFAPKLVKKSEGFKDKRKDKTVDRFNYRLTLFTFTSLLWIHQDFYNSSGIKQIPR